MGSTNIMTLGVWTLGKMLTKNSMCWKKECTIEPRNQLLKKGLMVLSLNIKVARQGFYVMFKKWKLLM